MIRSRFDFNALATAAQALRFAFEEYTIFGVDAAQKDNGHLMPGIETRRGTTSFSTNAATICFP